MKNMDYFSAKRHFDKYGFTTDFSTLSPDSIRYPPGVNIPKGLVNTPRLKERLSVDNASLNPKLENFAEMYQQMASNLLNMSVDKLIPPGHPMYSKENSITLLKEENQKILKENLELKKKLEDKKSSKKI
jgi:hypothetical protein|tara:strand:- start:1157 stop:1546 length:390 start_codon:yes stop_codon:yes gene_type:complete